MSRIWVGAASVAAAGVVVLLLVWPAPAEAPVIDFPAPVTTAGLVTVHVSGLVARPGLVSVTRGSRVADVIRAAGGALPEADIGSINLAAQVVDGQQLVVPGPGEVVETDATGMVRLNSADATVLQQLPGVGPVLAERIVSHRDNHGPFTEIEDLLDVAGIGEAKLAALRDLVIVP